MGSIFYFVDNLYQKSGNIVVHAHDEGSIDLKQKGKVCGTFGYTGGVLNCERMARYVTLYCESGCSPRFDVAMFRVWAELAISFEVTPTIGVNNISTKLDKIGQVTGVGSYLYSQACSRRGSPGSVPCS